MQRLRYSSADREPPMPFTTSNDYHEASRTIHVHVRHAFAIPSQLQAMAAPTSVSTELTAPPPAHLPDNPYQDPTARQDGVHISSDDERETTELRSYSAASDRTRRRRRGSLETRATHSTGSDSQSQASRKQRGGLLGSIQTWWRRQISVTVPAAAMRDHLGTASSSPPTLRSRAP